MANDEKMKKICDDFSLLSEEQQNYILGILQALVFANSSYLQSEHKDSMSVNDHDNS